MTKQRLCKVGNEGGHDYIFYINNDQLLTWARNNRILAYINNDPVTRDSNLKRDMRYFICAINDQPNMREYNLGLFAEDEEQLYSDFLDMINEEIELGSLGIINKATA